MRRMHQSKTRAFPLMAASSRIAEPGVDRVQRGATQDNAHSQGAMDRAKRLAEESIPSLLLKFSAPTIVGLMAQATFYAVDRVFVGQALNTHALAGITVAFPFMLILMALGMLAGFGGAAVISIRLGQKNQPEAERALGNGAVLLVAAAVLSTALGLLFLDPLLMLFGASETALPYARDYLGVIVLGAVFQIVGFGLNAMIRGEGNPKIAMVTMLLSVGLNTGLEPLFLFGFHWGMKGAAAATVLRRPPRPFGCSATSSAARACSASASPTSDCDGRSAAGFWPSVRPPLRCKSPLARSTASSTSNSTVMAATLPSR